MSFEQQVGALTAAINTLAAAIATSNGAVNAAVPTAPMPAPMPAPVHTPVHTPVEPPAPEQTPLPPPSPAPFASPQGMINYVMGAYSEMGAEKGAGIQNVMTSMGYHNINDVTPEHYSALYQGIESLKAS